MVVGVLLLCSVYGFMYLNSYIGLYYVVGVCPEFHEICMFWIGYGMVSVYVCLIIITFYYYIRGEDKLWGKE